MTLAKEIRCCAVTGGPKHHFFGYYDKSPWDISGRWMLGMESDFFDRPPTCRDPLTIGLIDTEDGNRWHPLAQTFAWNWQQGCMLQWLAGGQAGEVIFNDFQEGQFISRILNIHTGKERLLERPVYTVDPSGLRAISLSFPRLHLLRPGYGYDGLADRNAEVLAPEDDGLHALDLNSGERRLILSLADVAKFEPEAAFPRRIHRFNHAQFNRSGSRFGVLHRHQDSRGTPHATRLLTMTPEGSDLWMVSGDEMVSHYDWGKDDRIIAWARRWDIGDRYFLFQDQSTQIAVIGEETLDSDGHCSFSPDGQWILTDTYPDAERCRSLLLYHPEKRERIDIGRFYSMPMPDEIRCDLHPRWSPCGRKVCIDSTHEGTRQIYLLHLDEL